MICFRGICFWAACLFVSSSLAFDFDFCLKEAVRGAEKGRPVKVIFDTDICGDYDDVGALAILHALEDAGEAEILATVSCTRDCWSVAVIEILNRYYGRPEIPVGCTPPGTVKFGIPNVVKGFGLLDKYSGWYHYANSSDAPNAVEVYRKVLAAQPDGSVRICSVGFLTNLRLLLESKPDQYSPLNGMDLIRKKVSCWVAMACSYPSGNECNSQGDWYSSKIALDLWPTPVIFTDFQYGRTLYTGRAVAESDGDHNPVKDTFALRLTPREKITPRSWDQLAGHPSWDESAVLIAVRGIEPYFATERGRYAMVGEKGANVWLPSPDGRHLRVLEKMPKTEVGKVIDELMVRRLKK